MRRASGARVRRLMRLRRGSFGSGARGNSPGCLVESGGLRQCIRGCGVSAGPGLGDCVDGVPGRSGGGRVRDLIEVLVDRMNRYYREKESAEFEMDTLRAIFSTIGEYERGLKLYRRLEDDEKDGCGIWALRDR